MKPLNASLLSESLNRPKTHHSKNRKLSAEVLLTPGAKEESAISVLKSAPVAGFAFRPAQPLARPQPVPAQPAPELGGSEPAAGTRAVPRAAPLADNCGTRRQPAHTAPQPLHSQLPAATHAFAVRNHLRRAAGSARREAPRVCPRSALGQHTSQRRSPRKRTSNRRADRRASANSTSFLPLLFQLFLNLGPNSRTPRTRGHRGTPIEGSTHLRNARGWQLQGFFPLFELSSFRTGQTSARRHSFASRQPPAPPAAPSQRGAAAPGPAPRPLPRGSSPPARSPRLPTWPRRSGRSPSGEALRQESFFLCLPAPLRRSNPSRKPSVPRCPHRAAHPAPPGTPRSGSRPNPTALSPLGCGHAPAGAGLRDTARAGRCRRHLGRSQAGGKR